MLKINEIFYSLQGEGKSMGKPTLFIRLSGCTLQCSFCDTAYHTKSRELSKTDIELLSKHKHWTITGGEPLLQQEGIMKLIKDFKPNFVEMETNGTIMPNVDLMNMISCFNISPKEKVFQPKELKNKCEPIILEAAIEDRIIKFVYSNIKSSYFISKTIQKYNLLTSEVWIMAEGKTKKEQEAKQKEVWDFCMKKGFNFSARLHINVFNNKKGV